MGSGPFAALVATFLVFASLVSALDCPNCEKKNLSSLTMVCPKCQTLVHSSGARAKAKGSATLAIEVYYAGKRPDQLPEKGTIFLNRKQTGDLPLIDRSDKTGLVLSGVDREGLGVDYTAVYRGELRELREGVYDLQIQMSLPWLTEHLRQNRRVDFPRIGLKNGHTTLVRHIFRSPGTFSSRPRKEEEQAHPSVTLLAPAKSGRNVRAPAIVPPPASDTFKPWRNEVDPLPQPELRMGSGTIGIDLPVF